MICPKCGREVINGSVVCPGCGNNLNQASQQNVYNQNNISQQNVDNNFNNMKVGKKFNFIPLVIVGVVLVAVGGFIFFNKKDVTHKGKNNNITDEMTFDVENELSDEDVKKLTTCSYDIFSYQNNYDENGTFFMPIEDVFTITGKGIVVTGMVYRGKVNVGDKVQIIGIDNNVINSSVIEIEYNRDVIETAKMGDRVGLLLKGIDKEDVERGKVIIKPNSMTTKKVFEADIQLLTKEQGGLDDFFFESQRVAYYFYTSDYVGNIYFAEGLNKLNPGDCAKVVIELNSEVAMEIGKVFSIRAGGKTIGAGVVTETDASKIKYSKDVIDRYASLRNDPNREFLMYVEDVFTLTGRGTAVSGAVENGILFEGDKVEIIGSNGKRTLVVKGVSSYRGSKEYIETGDNATILFSDIDREDIERGDKIVLIR